MSAVLKFQQELETKTCGECGVTFAAPAYFWSERKQTGATWYCPNGHARIFGKTAAQELQEQLEREREQHRQRLDFERNQTAAVKRELVTVKGQLTKTKKRVANGVCPCCQRSFVQLKRHIATKHPDYTV